MLGLFGEQSVRATHLPFGLGDRGHNHLPVLRSLRAQEPQPT